MASDLLSNLPNEILLQIFGHFCLHCQDEYSQSWDSRPLRLKREPPHRTRQRKPPHRTIQWEPPYLTRQRRYAKPWHSINRQTLVSLSLASKRLGNVAQSVLHHEFTLGYGLSCTLRLSAWRGRLASFMRCLAQRRDLARSVRVCYISEGLPEPKSRDENRAVMLEAAHALGIDLPTAWRRRISNASAHEKRDWPEAYDVFLASHLDGKGTWDERQLQDLHAAFNQGLEHGRRWMNTELVVMLIALMPNLDYISLQGSYRWPTHGLPHSAFSALGISSLPLKTLDLGVAGIPLLQLASGLETLNLHHQRSLSGPPFPNMPGLKTLRVTDCLVSAKTLGELLAACTGGLTAFEFEARYDRTPDHFQIPEAVWCLERHRDTLKVLHLDFSKGESRMSKIPDYLDLKHFSVLEHVFLNSTILFGVVPIAREHEVDHQVLIRLLPASIISLSAKNDGRWTRCLEETLLALACWKSQNPHELPSLKSIHSDVISKGTKTLASLFEAVGVDFDIRVCGLSDVKPYVN